MAKKFQKPIPATQELWLAEISMAYKSAEAFIKSGMVPENDLPKVEPWHLAPLFCLVSRGANPSDTLVDEAGRQAYLNFDEAFSPEEAEALHPVIAFAFCYLEAHRGLGLIDQEQTAQLLALVDSNESALDMMLKMVDEIFEAENPFDPALLHEPPAAAPKKGKAAGKKNKKNNPTSEEISAAAGAIFILEITLLGIEPPVWRRVAVPGRTTLDLLHEIIQAVMGFDGGFDHLHEFEIGKQSYAPPEIADEGSLDESRFQLCDLVPKAGRKIIYTYDFGDNWEHEVVVKKIEPPRPGEQYPRCLDGGRAAPPDDCGGPWGYEELLEARLDPESEDYERAIEWLGEDFDPESFDCRQVNERLRKLA